MPKSGKLTVLKSALKRMNSFGIRTTTSTTERTTTHPTTTTGYDDRRRHHQPVSSQRLHTVYVGKSRREYQVTSEVADHPAFQALLRKSNEAGSGPAAGEITVACEVVLFEHLLWMLENIDPDEMDSPDELVALYS